MFENIILLTFFNYLKTVATTPGLGLWAPVLDGGGTLGTRGPLCCSAALRGDVASI